MKKLILTSVLLVAVVTVQYAQSEQPNKKEIKQEKAEAKGLKKEAKVIKHEDAKEKRELRRLEGKEVSKASKDAFTVDFGNIAGVKWVRSSYFDEASFVKDGTDYKAFYDDKATLIGTTAVKTVADLPAGAAEKIAKHYKGYKIDKVIYFNDNEGNDAPMNLYNSLFNAGDAYFVEIKNQGKAMVLMVSTNGDVSFFEQL